MIHDKLGCRVTIRLNHPTSPPEDERLTKHELFDQLRKTWMSNLLQISPLLQYIMCQFDFFKLAK